MSIYLSVERADYYIPINLPVLRGTGGIARIEPPSGTRAINYRMNLFVSITDKLGAETVYKIDEIEVFFYLCLLFYTL